MFHRSQGTTAITPRPLDPRIENFLDAGSPPLLVGMGSAPGFDATRLARMFVAASRLAGARAIVERGWAGLDVATSADGTIDPFTPNADLFAALTRNAVDAHEPRRIAREIASRLRGEAGIAATCDAIEQFISAS